MGDTLLTVNEVAARLAIGRTTLYQLITSQELRTVKIGRARRIPESAVNEWIARHIRDQEPEGKPEGEVSQLAL